jgi:hypothetical protein
LAPPEALVALEAHYTAQAQWEARQQEWAEDWGAAVFRFEEERTECFPWNESWILYAHGGTYSTKAMVERHRWAGKRLVKDGPSAPPLKVEVEQNVPLLRIDTNEGCCDARWTQASWYTDVGGMHRVLSVPVAIHGISSPWPVNATAIWAGAEWSEEEQAGPLTFSLRYTVPTLGNRETILRGRLEEPGAEVLWTEAGDSGIADGLALCRKSRTSFCPLRALTNWVNAQVGLATPMASGGAPRSVSQLSEMMRLESVVMEGSGRERAFATLRGKRNLLLSCYERATRGAQELSGPLIVSMDVSGGRVSDVELNAGPDHPSFGLCIQKRMKRVRFPAVVEGAVIGVWSLGPE